MSKSEDRTIVRITPYCYIHVLDQTTNVTRVEMGPLTFIRKDNEKVVSGIEKMVVIPPRHYCVVENPVVKHDGRIVTDALGQVQHLHGEMEVRMDQDPFPLHPGEILHTKVTPLQVVPINAAFRLQAIRDFEDGEVKRVTGDEWLFEGPGTYIPRKEVEIKSKVSAKLIYSNQALKLRAMRDTTDRDGKNRVAGEEWLVRREGLYLPGAFEEVVEVVKAHILTEKVAVHVQATKTFKDQMGVTRKNGAEWLVTFSDMETYICDVYEQVLGIVNIITLTNRQYCVICNPVGESGKPQLGQRKLVKGEKSFFLQPGEELENGIQGVHVLGDNEGLILQANEAFQDLTAGPVVERNPGDKWMITGPLEYVPPVEVEIIRRQTAVSLHENEGIYVRNTKTGQVRAVIGQTYMINQDEELWAKYIPPLVRRLLSADRDVLADRGEWVNPRKQQQQQQQQRQEENFIKSKSKAVEEPGAACDATRVVTFQVPHNAAVQVYDYRSKKSRVVFGPDLVMLAPDEHFTQLSLSGGKPKKANVIRALALLLGPDFCTDVITIETADHARLQLQVSYNWHFETGTKTEEDASKLFSVPDFIGDMCNAIASRIRGAVSAVRFDDFHKTSAEIIRMATFGVEENQKLRERLNFTQNNLVVTSVDIRSVEPVDQRTRDSLQKSVQLAIEITINSQEATAKHEAERIEQEAKGRLERQRILDEAAAEKARKELLLLQSASAAVESCGQTKAEAQSRAEAAQIEGEAAVMQAKLKAEASTIEAESELLRLKHAREAEIAYNIDQNKLEIEKTKELAKIEVEKFRDMVAAIGSDTLREMSTSGMNQQVHLLQALGLKSTLITDGRTPVNLLNTAHGLLGVSGPFVSQPESG